MTAERAVCANDGGAAACAHGEAVIRDRLAAFLAANRDEGYQAFQAKLIPNIDSASIIGVRTPVLRRFAKALAREGKAEVFLSLVPHGTFEENQLHAFIVADMRDFDEYVAELRAFLPLVDNWATCDQLSPRTLAEQPERALDLVRQWLADGRTYVVRFAIGVLLQLFLDERFSSEQMGWVAAVESDEYYVNMMRAWYMAEAVAKQPEVAVALLEAGSLDRWTHNKAIQKARESLRVPVEMKAHLATLRRRER